MLERRLHIEAQGHTLVELLLVLSLMAVVLHVIPGAYQMMQRTIITIEQEKKSMERFEAIYHHMNPWVSLAGYYGCTSEKAAPELLVHGIIPHSGLYRRAVYTLYQSRDGGWSPPLPPILEGKLAPGTDALQIEGAGPWYVHPIKPVSQASNIIPLAMYVPPAAWYLIADCEHVELFTADFVQGEKIRGLRPHVRLKYTYDQSAVLSPWFIQTFYLDKDPHTLGYTLNRKSLLPADPALGLISGIEGWRLSKHDNILQIDVQGGESLTLWMRFDHAL